MTKEPRPHIAKSAQRDDWETPYDLFDSLDDEFGPFTMDAAAALGQRSANIVLERGGKIAIAPPEGHPVKGRVPAINPRILYDAFEHPWTGRVWLNSPYGPIELLTAFVEKAAREVLYGNAELVCALLPSRTGTGWWQDYVLPEVMFWEGSPQQLRGVTVVRFLRGRVTFVGANDCAPFPSAVVVWGAR